MEGQKHATSKKKEQRTMRYAFISYLCNKILEQVTIRIIPL